MTLTLVPQETSYHKENTCVTMKALSLTILKLLPMLKFFNR